MLSNAYFHAKFRFDTAENEPTKNLLVFPILLTLIPNRSAHSSAARLSAFWSCISSQKARRSASSRRHRSSSVTSVILWHHFAIMSKFKILRICKIRGRICKIRGILILAEPPQVLWPPSLPRLHSLRLLDRFLIPLGIAGQLIIQYTLACRSYVPNRRIECKKEPLSALLELVPR